MDVGECGVERRQRSASGEVTRGQIGVAHLPVAEDAAEQADGDGDGVRPELVTWVGHEGVERSAGDRTVDAELHEHTDEGELRDRARRDGSGVLAEPHVAARWCT